MLFLANQNAEIDSESAPDCPIVPSSDLELSRALERTDVYIYHDIICMICTGRFLRTKYSSSIQEY